MIKYQGEVFLPMGLVFSKVNHVDKLIDIDKGLEVPMSKGSNEKDLRTQDLSKRWGKNVIGV